MSGRKFTAVECGELLLGLAKVEENLDAKDKRIAELEVKLVDALDELEAEVGKHLKLLDLGADTLEILTRTLETIKAERDQLRGALPVLRCVARLDGAVTCGLVEDGVLSELVSVHMKTVRKLLAETK